MTAVRRPAAGRAPTPPSARQNPPLTRQSTPATSPVPAPARCHPDEPSERHVWVRGHLDYGAPVPGVVVSWQHTPVHNANAADWLALVVMNPFGNALLLQWVGAERLIPVRDPTPRP